VRAKPYLNFDGDCRAALEKYAEVLGGRITFMMTMREAPIAADVPPGWGDKIMHATLTAGDVELQAADAPPQHYQKPQGLCVSLEIDDPAEAERIYGALSEGGSVTMPIQETFWARRFAMFRDRHGIPWMVNCARPT
jgi:PhnB protein